MDPSLFESPSAFLEAIFRYEIGSSAFNLVLGVCLVTWVVVARITMAICSSRRGFIAAFFGLILSVVVGYIGGIVALYHGVPNFDAEWAEEVVPLLGFALGVLLTAVVVLVRIWKLSIGVCLFIFCLASAASTIAYFGAEMTLNMVEYGGQHIEKRDQRSGDALDSLL